MLNILITSSNTSSLVSTAYSLRKARYCSLIGIDRKGDNLAKHLLNTSYVWKRPSKESYLKRIKELCGKHKITMVIPHSIQDRILLMNHKKWFEERKIHILSSSSESIELCENKERFMELCERIGIPTPEQHVARTKEELTKFSKDLGYPKEKIIVKPVQSKGSRGFRILNEALDAKRAFFSSRGDMHEITLKGLLDILGEEFPPMIISEYLPGAEYSVDCFSHKDFHVAIPRERTIIKHGLTHFGCLLANKRLEERCKKLAQEIGLDSIYGFQFKKDKTGKYKILECNARIQGTMIMSTLAGANLFELAIEAMEGKKLKKPSIDWEMKFQRIPGGISYGQKKQVVAPELT